MSGMLINLIIQIVAGAIGGNVAGVASKDVSLGTAGNTIAGAIGGGVGGQILGALIPLLANTASTIDIGALVGQAAGGGVAGAILTAVVGLIKNKMASKLRQRQSAGLEPADVILPVPAVAHATAGAAEIFILRMLRLPRCRRDVFRPPAQRNFTAII